MSASSEVVDFSNFDPFLAILSGTSRLARSAPSGDGRALAASRVAWPAPSGDRPGEPPPKPLKLLKNTQMTYLLLKHP